MSDKPTQHRAEDGSTYAAEIVPPDSDAYGQKYHVDLVRTTTDAAGLDQTQRLTIGQYGSWGEAEEHLLEVEETLTNDGLAGLGEEGERLRQQPIEVERVYLAVTYPPDAPEAETPSAAHLLAVGEGGIDSAGLAAGDRETVAAVVERVDAAFAEGGLANGLAAAKYEAEVHLDQPPTTPLFDPDDGAVRFVDGGGTAHWFSVVEREKAESDITADAYELRYFRALELDDGTQRTDAYPVMPLPDDDPGSAWALPGLELYLEKGDVYMAQQLAHDVADAYGQDFPQPLDLPSLDPRPEYYFGYGVGPNNAPSLEAVKTWMDGAERRFDTLTVGEYGMYDEAAVDERELETLMDEQGLETAMNQAETMAVAGGYLDEIRDDPRIFFEDDAPDDPFTTNRERELADPSYSINAISANGEHFLDVMKSWSGDEDYERLVVPQPNWEDARDKAVQANEMLDDGRLQEAMRLVELEGVRAGVIDPDRADLRLFTQGPPDPFETLAQRLEGETNPYWNTDGEVIDEPEVKTVADNPYWRLETLPVNDPSGEPLGHALHMVVYDGVEHETEAIGTPAMAENEPFRRLEMAHFETTDAADKFGEEFNGYLMPGLLEGPELAEEVARLEGHPVEWKTLEGQALADYRDLKLTLTRDPVDWQPYNPNAERDARIEAEGLYTNPIQQFVKLDEEEDEPKVEPVSPDFDL